MSAPRINRMLKETSIIVEEMRTHALFFDEKINPQNDLASIFLETHTSAMRYQIKMIEKIQKFITSCLIQDRALFEYALQQHTMFEVQLGNLEELFFELNGIFSINSLTTIDRNVRYSSDMKAFLDLAEDRVWRRGNRTWKEFDLINEIEDETLHASRLQQWTQDILDDKAKKRRLRFERLKRFSVKSVSKDSHLVRHIKNVEEIVSRLSLASTEVKQADRYAMYLWSVKLIEILYSFSHTDSVNQANSQASARFRRANQYVDNLFEIHKNLTFISLDLEFDEIGGDVKIYKEHLKRFLNGRRKHAALSKMVGYLGKWESYGSLKPLYLRMVCIFPKQKAYVEQELPNIIGSYWRYNVLDGAGKFHCSKLSAHGPLNVTLCQISANKQASRAQLQERVIFYLTHIQKYYHSEELSEFRESFFKGELSGVALRVSKDQLKLRKIKSAERQQKKNERK